MASRRFSFRCKRCRRLFSTTDAVYHRMLPGHELSRLRMKRKVVVPDPPIVELAEGFKVPLPPNDGKGSSGEKGMAQCKDIKQLFEKVELPSSGPLPQTIQSIDPVVLAMRVPVKHR